MNWAKFLKSGLLLVQNLANLEGSNEARLAKLTERVTEFLEEVDDLVAFLPLGYAKLLVDNPATDALQRQLVAQPIAELLYQSWKTATQAAADLESFTDGVVILGGAPVPAL